MRTCHSGYLAAVTTAAWLAVVGSAVLWPPASWPPAAGWELYVVAAIVGEALVVPLPLGGLQSMGFVPIFAAVVALGPHPAAFVAAIGVAVGNGLVHRRPTRTTLFNTGQLALAALCAGYLYAALQPRDLGDLLAAATVREMLAGPAPRLVVALAAACLVYTGLSEALVAGATALRERRPYREILAGNIGWELLNALPQGVAGAVVGLVVRAAVRPVALLVVVPLGLVSYVLLLYATREQAHRDVATLYDTAVDVARSPSLGDRLRIIADAARHLARAERAAIAIADADGARYAIADGQPLEPVGPDDLAVRVIAGRQMVVESTGGRHAVGVPLRAGAEVVGAIVVEHAGPQAFPSGTPRYARALETLAQQAALAIRNAQLFEETRRTVDRLAALQRLGSVVNSTLDPTQVFDAFTAMAASAVGADGARLGIFDPLAGALMIRSAHGIVEDLAGAAVPADAAAASPGVRAFRERRPVVVEDLPRDAAAAFYGGHPVRSVLAVPVVARGEAIGALAVHAGRPAAFGAEETVMLQAIADQGGIAIANARLYQEAKDAAAALGALHEAAEAISSSLELPAVLDAIVSSACQAFRYDFGAIALHDEATGELVIQSAYGYQQGVERWRLPPGRGVMGWVARTGQPLAVPDVSKDARYIPGDDSIRSELAVPLIAGGRVIGVFNVESTRPDAFAERDARLLTMLANTATIAITNARLYAETKRLAITDGLTGLHNHRYLHERLEAEVERARRYGAPVSVVMFEVDQFKRYNDSFGHRQGDLVLRVIGQLLTVSSRSADIVARYGGDEFTIVMPHTPKDAAREAAERIRRAVELYPFSLSDGVTAAVTLSSGIAALPDDGLTADALIETADRAMYQAKRSGGNTVHLAPA